MQFPAELPAEYVRVYQQKGETDIGCNPLNYPTGDYNQNHFDTYSSTLFRIHLCYTACLLLRPPRPALDPHLTAFDYPVPKNGLVSTPIL